MRYQIKQGEINKNTNNMITQRINKHKFKRQQDNLDQETEITIYNIYLMIKFRDWGLIKPNPVTKCFAQQFQY
ncbi:unnamed protein product (macronuclear) [Paramecium tetraurelia]|uniref:Uncharacterized protein n=1 Tax=Paramecium tetraurelia TaxID=5888 RepID=A0BJE5_PARTE|nr:uncharacterized protein GSPATT00005035001 [Paramecium tetraurelia]CAK58662.1 unnamed protein product [Paramecium tetraurelia]|eukprot:XP_001426060.1 hypothetical protein (macronuclear) [Paramecium tetraurelia strain d4-2]